MDEFRAELDGNRQAGHLERPDAAADTVARFEDCCRLPAAGKLRRCRQTCGAGTQDYDVV
jgi:hypothetical protein